MITKSSGPDGVGFDADAFNEELRTSLSALAPPYYRQHGRLRQGRLLSFDQWRAFEPDFHRYATLSERQKLALHYRYLMQVFPEPWWKFPALLAALVFCVGWPLFLLPHLVSEVGPVWARVLASAVGVYVWYRIARRNVSVAWSIMQLPLAAQWRAIQRFLQAQAPATAVWLTLIPRAENQTSTRRRDGEKPKE